MNKQSILKFHKYAYTITRISRNYLFSFIINTFKLFSPSNDCLFNVLNIIRKVFFLILINDLNLRTVPMLQLHV